jgi:hypothetical protein
MGGAAEVDVFDEKISGEEQVVGGSAGVKNAAVVPDPEDDPGGVDPCEFPNPLQEGGFRSVDWRRRFPRSPIAHVANPSRDR